MVYVRPQGPSNASFFLQEPHENWILFTGLIVDNEGNNVLCQIVNKLNSMTISFILIKRTVVIEILKIEWLEFELYKSDVDISNA
jgi:hypothetical protein